MKPKYRQPGIGRRVLRFAPYLLVIAVSFAAFVTGYWLMGPLGFWSLGLVVTAGACALVGVPAHRRAREDWARIEGRRRSKLRDAIEHPADEDMGSASR